MDQKSKPKKLRTACDFCHRAKMKCSGGHPCDGCKDSGFGCSYSVSNRIGRPKGTKNKRTLERLSRETAENQGKSIASDQDQGLLTARSQDHSSSNSPLTATPTNSEDLSIDAILRTLSGTPDPLWTDPGQMQLPDPLDVVIPSSDFSYPLDIEPMRLPDSSNAWYGSDGLGNCVSSVNGTIALMEVRMSNCR